ncbi:unnamed protein product, partial [Mesorhabditis belari]|uniref:G-protein coupled receptors family 1 profile domain-containing protein n=1 Tax=Mesorhabditis belari TaxID=2138241 RepID=A0AAF3EYN1_9BILA
MSESVLSMDLSNEEHFLPSSPILSLLWMFGFIIFVGLLLNIYVVHRLNRLAKKDREQWLNGTGVYLHVMAVSDCFSLVLLFSLLVLQVISPLLEETMLSGMCKSVVLFSHFSYTMSMYCWLCMSALRYHAARDPLKYSTVWRSPFSLLMAVGAISFLLNLHIFISVDGNRKTGCTLSDDGLSRLYSLADVVVSCLIPSILILLMDVRVLCCRDQRRHSDPLLQIVFHKPDEETEKRRAATMRRFMVVTLVCLLLSLPELSLRALLSLHPNAKIPIAVFCASKTLYFVKFSFNAFYLTSYVFDRNVLSKTNSSRQLSISARRLEECPAITPRERSHTMSYRVATPIPLLTRNSSCINLDSTCESPQTPKHWL